jgi:hypothetical protein
MGKARDLGKEQFWRRTFRRWEQSGSSVAASCRRERLADCTFYWWRRELSQRKVAVPSLVPVQVLGDVEPGSALELHLPGHRRLLIRLIRPGFDRDTFWEVLRLLEEPAC